MTIVNLKGGRKVPVPEGYSIDRVVEILREVGLHPTSVKEHGKRRRKVA